MSKELEDLAYIKEQLPVYDSMGFMSVIDESDFVNIEKALKEHEQYKAIEEKLGVDLVKLFNAKKLYYYDVVVVKNEEQYVLKETERFEICLKEKQVCIYETEYDDIGTLLDKKEYGKKVLYGWALTKEELL